MQLQQLSLLYHSAINANLVASLLESPTTPEPLTLQAKPSLNELFTRYQAMALSIEDLARQQQQFEEEYFGRQITDTPSMQGIRRIADKALDSLISLAESKFAPAGTQLEICSNQSLARTGQDKWKELYERHWDKFRLAKRNATVALSRFRSSHAKRYRRLTTGEPCPMIEFENLKVCPRQWGLATKRSCRR
jgi:hypothetical protein